jgi:protease I
MNRALIVTYEGYQDQEVIYPYYRLLAEEFQVDVYAEKIGTFYGIMGTKMEANKSIKHLLPENVNKYNFLVLPGGVKALEKLRQEKNVLNFITEFVNDNKIVASTCHGAQLLISAKVVFGKNISGYYSIADDINNAGAAYVDAPVVVDGNLITSPHYKHMGIWMETAINEFYKTL